MLANRLTTKRKNAPILENCSEARVRIKRLYFLQTFLGSFASLKAVFSFRRRTESFVSAIFVPAVVLVVLSWCCFFISPSAVPARVALSITTILTSILLKGNVNRDMPKVSYMKAVDYFLLTSFGFIFAALIEFIIVLNTSPVFSPPSWFKKDKRGDKKEIAMECEVSGGGKDYPQLQSFKNDYFLLSLYWMVTARLNNLQLPSVWQMYRGFLLSFVT